MNRLRCILLVEDSARDAELILDALESHRLSNEIVHVRDGAEALDYLYRRGPFGFWALLNEVPERPHRSESSG